MFYEFLKTVFITKSFRKILWKLLLWCKMHLNNKNLITKMIYKCTQCNYFTIRRCDLRRHEEKKKPCNVKVDEVVNNRKSTQNVDAPTQNVDAPTQNVDAPTQNVDAPTHTQNVDVTKSKQLYFCSKCDIGFVRRNNMKRHETHCKGLDSLRCEICFKTFTSRSGKAHHKKLSCVPNQPINNHVTHITNNVTNNHNIMNITQNIQLNFGKECMIELCNEHEYSTKIRENIQCGKYALVRSIDDIYFNDRYPNNQTIKKERRNDKMVEILVNGKWEKRLFEDVFKPISSKIENYHAKYFKDLLNDSEHLQDGNNKYDIRKFGHQMVWYGWRMNMFEDLGFILNQPDDDEEKKRRSKDVFSLLMEKIYERSHDENGSLCLSESGSVCS